MTALTLIEAAGFIKDPMQRSLVELYAASTPLLGAIPFQPVDGGALTFMREAELPEADWRKINAGFGSSTGKMEKVTEYLHSLGGDVDVDTFIVKTGQGDVRAMQETMQVKSIAQTFDRAFIKGSAVDDADGITGLQARLAGTGQEIDNGTAGLKLDKFDEGIHTCEGANALFMNKAMIRRLTAASRNTSVGGFITFQQDQFGRQVAYYGGLPILEADPFGHKNSPLDFTEPTSTTSIYVLNLSAEGVVGLQHSTPEIRDLGETDDAPVERSRVEWLCGMAIFNPRAAVRIKGITNAAVTV